MLGQFHRHDLVENASLGSQQNDRAAALLLRVQGPEHAFDRRKDRFHFHDHPAAPAVRFIVGDMVLVRGPVTDIMDTYIDQPALAGALKNAAFKIRGKNFRQECEDVELHASILAVSGMSDKRIEGIDAHLHQMVR